MPPDATSAPAATFRPDARPLVWGACFCAVMGIAGAIPAFALSLELPFRFAFGIPAVFFLLFSFRLAGRILARRSESYLLGTLRLEIESGIFSRKSEAVELWRIKDIVLEQTVADRLLGNGHLTIFSSDQTEPVLRLGPIRDARELTQRLRDAAAQARKDGRVMQVGS